MTEQNTALTKQGNDRKLLSDIILHNDISKLTEQQKTEYYMKFCNSLGLNPLTKPFQIITFQGKQILYATKDATEQLRKLNRVSIVEIVIDNSMKDRDLYIVKTKVQDADGRFDVGTGAVSVKGLSGDALANAVMKAETKSKRRATLSICGLGILDESETDTLGGYKTEPITVSDEPKKEANPPQKKTETVEDLGVDVGDGTDKPPTDKSTGLSAVAFRQTEIIAGLGDIKECKAFVTELKKNKDITENEMFLLIDRVNKRIKEIQDASKNAE